MLVQSEVPLACQTRAEPNAVFFGSTPDLNETFSGPQEYLGPQQGIPGVRGQCLADTGNPGPIGKHCVFYTGDLQYALCRFGPVDIGYAGLPNESRMLSAAALSVHPLYITEFTLSSNARHRTSHPRAPQAWPDGFRYPRRPLLGNVHLSGPTRQTPSPHFR